MKTLLLQMAVLVLSANVFAEVTPMKKGKPDLQSIGTLEFAPDGTLFIGDSKSAAVFAVDLQDNEKSDNIEALQIADLEGKLAALLGTTSDKILIHDMAVNPISQNTYLSVSRGRSNWTSKWMIPNEAADAMILIKIDPKGELSEASLENVLFSKATLPNPINAEKEHKWKKGVTLRADAISDISYSDGKLYIAGLSNEEFASSMWVIPYPFKEEASATTLEIYHGAHGAYETHAPIRAFLPYTLNNKNHLLAAYLCTPLVTFEVSQLKDGQHVKGRTVAEFGAGNYPIDMVTYENNGNEYILMSNSQLPLLILDPKDVESYEGEITEEVQGYLAGVKYTPRSGSGIYHLANFNEKYIVMTQRMANGKLILSSLSKAWLMP
ncbi:MAG: hypothetical protein KI790_04725 [Cyclobacteriaceae bacterium]|nr:hypothetical protein [Cyclobacteriaceae bacterium HetDA_MAG_MS6]